VPSFRKFVEEKAGEDGAAMLRTAAAHPEYFKRLIEKTTGKASEEEVELLRQAARDQKNFIIRGTSELSLAQVVQQADVIAPIILDMRWLFLVAPEGSRFLTADAPVVWVDRNKPSGASAGLMMPNTILSFPISPRLCLLGTWLQLKGSRDIPAGAVDGFNLLPVRFADRFIFSDNKAAAWAALQARKDMEQRGEKLGVPPYALTIFGEGER
jgi:hypothetical protein